MNGSWKVRERATGLSLLFAAVSFWDQLALLDQRTSLHYWTKGPACITGSKDQLALLDQRFTGDLFKFAVRSVLDLNKAGDAWKTKSDIVNSV